MILKLGTYLNQLPISVSVRNVFLPIIAIGCCFSCFLIPTYLLDFFGQDQCKEMEGIARKLNSALTTLEAVDKVKALEEENEDMAVSTVT